GVNLSIAGLKFWPHIAGTVMVKQHDKRMCFMGAAITTAHHSSALTLPPWELVARQQHASLNKESLCVRFPAKHVLQRRRWLPSQRGVNDRCVSRLTKKCMKAK